jgi:hypothetical protein
MILLLVTCTGGTFAQKILFNGKDLSGWKVHGTEKWLVR